MDKPLRLLVIGVAWPMETFLDRLLRGLAAQGFEITVASGEPPSAEWLKATGAHWLPAPMWRGFSPSALLRLGALLFRSVTLARSDARLFWQQLGKDQSWFKRVASWYLLASFAGKRRDLIYIPWNFHAITFLPLFSIGMPVVLSCRGSQMNIAPNNPRRAHLLPPLRATFEQAAAVHCVSEDILREAQRWGLDPARARVIHPAVDPDFFHPVDHLVSADAVFRIITIGSLIWVKGLEYALLAVRILADAGVPVQFDIIGDGPERSRILYTIADLGLSSCVCLTGKLPPERVRSHLQQSHVFLLSSLSEGISNAVLEAMSCALPVVTSDCGGMREAVTDGVEGFVVPNQDPGTMARAMLKLWQSPDLRQRMGQAGREKVLKYFTLKNQVDQFHDLFLQVTRFKSDSSSTELEVS